MEAKAVQHGCGSFSGSYTPGPNCTVSDAVTGMALSLASAHFSNGDGVFGDGDYNEVVDVFLKEIKKRFPDASSQQLISIINTAIGGISDESLGAKTAKKVLSRSVDAILNEEKASLGPFDLVGQSGNELPRFSLLSGAASLNWTLGKGGRLSSGVLSLGDPFSEFLPYVAYDNGLTRTLGPWEFGLAASVGAFDSIGRGVTGRFHELGFTASLVEFAGAGFNLHGAGKLRLGVQSSQTFLGTANLNISKNPKMSAMKDLPLEIGAGLERPFSGGHSHLGVGALATFKVLPTLALERDSMGLNFVDAGAFLYVRIPSWIAGAEVDYSRQDTFGKIFIHREFEAGGLKLGAKMFLGTTLASDASNRYSPMVMGVLSGSYEEGGLEFRGKLNVDAIQRGFRNLTNGDREPFYSDLDYIAPFFATDPTGMESVCAWTQVKEESGYKTEIHCSNPMDIREPYSRGQRINEFSCFESGADELSCGDPYSLVEYRLKRVRQGENDTTWVYSFEGRPVIPPLKDSYLILFRNETLDGAVRELLNQKMTSEALGKMKVSFLYILSQALGGIKGCETGGEISFGKGVDLQANGIYSDIRNCTFRPNGTDLGHGKYRPTYAFLAHVGNLLGLESYTVELANQSENLQSVSVFKLSNGNYAVMNHGPKIMPILTRANSLQDAVAAFAMPFSSMPAAFRVYDHSGRFVTEIKTPRWNELRAATVPDRLEKFVRFEE